LKATHAELVRAMAETGFDRKPPALRDRNGFVNSLMHGERDTLERVRPRWLEYKRNVKRAKQIKTELDALIRQRVLAEPGYRALAAEADRERKARHACQQLIDTLRAAREQVTRADTTPPDDTSRATVKRDADEVSKRLGAVRRHADDLRTNLPDGRSFQPGELAGLQITFSRGDSPKKRSKKYAELAGLLSSLERTVTSLRREFEARENEIRAKQNQYLKDGVARYNR
jgi:hypothetical protein